MEKKIIPLRRVVDIAEATVMFLNIRRGMVDDILNSPLELRNLGLSDADRLVVIQAYGEF